MKSIILIIFFSTLVVFLGACAGTPEVTDPSGIDLTFRVLEEGELLRYTVDKGLNPYTNVGMLIKRPEDFIVLRVLMTTARPMSFEIALVEAFDAEGREIASSFDKDAFLDHLKRWTTEPGDYTRLETEVQHSYLPYGALRLKPGKRSYILVLAGPRPMPKAITLRGLAFIDNSTSSIEVTLSDD